MSRWVTFDCYGTLIDWNGGIASVFRRLWPDRDADDLRSVYHAVEPLIERDGSLPYRQVLRRGLRTVAAALDLPLPADQASALADSLPSWPPFPEVPEALAQLRQSGWKLGILSNTDPEYLDASVAHLGVDIDVLVVASAIGSYKPGHAHWHEFRRMVGETPERHVHVAASLYHDIAPCAELGIPAVWINRLGEMSDLPRMAELTDLGPLPAALG